jgi:hypothetical protein
VSGVLTTFGLEGWSKAIKSELAAVFIATAMAD